MNDKLIRYSIQIAMLKQLLSRNLISEKEYLLAKQRIMKEYKIISDKPPELCDNNFYINTAIGIQKGGYKNERSRGYKG